MIDFQNNTITSRPPKEIINYSIIFRREETLDALRRYKLEAIGNDNEDPALLSKFSAHLYTLLVQNKPMLNKSWDEIKNNPYKDIEALERATLSQKESQVLSALDFIEEFLYKKGLTKTDTRENLETHSIIRRNKASGL